MSASPAGRFLNLQSRFLLTVVHAADKLGMFRRSFAADDLIATAQKATGFSDFGDWSFREPLAVLLRAYEQEAQLSAFGRIATRWDILRFLSNLLRLREEEKRSPQILDQSIKRPIFILGMPRSGETFLHNLLALDAANIVPRAWQTIYPYPVQTKGTERRPELVAQGIRHVPAICTGAPEPPHSGEPQECIEITGHVMRSLRFDTTHYIRPTRSGSTTRAISKPIAFTSASCSICSIRTGVVTGF